MYDAIVVGARCAGSPTAMLLARRGYRVLLVDRATFPSDTISTHFIQMPGLARLKRWGLLDHVLETGCPPVTYGMLDINGEQMRAELEVPAGLTANIAPRRTILDKILLDGAAEAGAEVREGVFIDSLLFEDGRVVGVEGHTATGAFTERARIVVGADGRNSLVARQVGAAKTHETPVLGSGAYSYWSGVECDGAEIYLYERHFAVAFPTHDGLTTVACAVLEEEYAETKKNFEAHMLTVWDQMGNLGERVRGGRREERILPISNLSNFIRESAGPGWALVGDAGYHKDPQPADGISDAFRAVDQLVDALDTALADPSAEKEALETYQRERDAAAMPHYEQTLKMSSFESTPLDRGTAFLELQGLHAIEVERLLNDAQPVG